MADQTTVGSATGCSAEDDLLTARWKEIAAVPDEGDLDFVVDAVFHQWEKLARVLPKGTCNSGQRYYTASDISRFSHDWRTYKLRCRAALLEWIRGHPDHGPNQLLESLKAAGLGSLIGRILAGLQTERPKSLSCLEMQSMSTPDQDTILAPLGQTEDLLPCIPSSEIRCLPEHPISKSRALGTNSTMAMWQGALIALRHTGGHEAEIASLQDRKDRIDRLQNDFRAMSQLRHPNIIAVYGLHAPKTGHVALVVEPMETTLYSRCRLQPKILYTDVLSVVTQVVSALVYAETMGIVLTDVCTKNTFLLKSHSGRYIAKVGGHAIVQKTLSLNRRQSVPQHLLAGSTSDLLQRRLLKRSHSAGVRRQDNIFSVGSMIIESLLGGELVGNSPQRWVADLSRQGYTNAQLIHLITKCLDRAPKGHITSVDLLDRLESISGSYTHQAMCVATPTIAPPTDVYYSQVSSAVGSGSEDCHHADADGNIILLQRLMAEKRALKEQVEYLKSTLLAHDIDPAQAIATIPTPRSPSPPPPPPPPRALSTASQGTTPEARHDNSEAAAASFEKASNSKSSVYDSDSCESASSGSYTGPSEQHLQNNEVENTNNQVLEEQADASSVFNDDIVVTFPPYNKQIQVATFGSTSPPLHPAHPDDGDDVEEEQEQVDKDIPTTVVEARNTRSSLALAMSSPRKEIAKRSKQQRVSFSMPDPAPSHATGDSSPERTGQNAATLWRVLRQRATIVGNFRRRRSSVDPQQRSTSQVITGTLRDSPLKRHQNSPASDAVSSSNSSQEEILTPPVLSAPHRRRPGVKCFARFSHVATDQKELTLQCGEPLIVWEGGSSGEGSDSSEGGTFYARSTITGSSGVVSPDNVVPLKRVKRRLHAYNFNSQPSYELERVKCLLGDKLPDGALSQFCNVLLKDMHGGNAFEIISNHCSHGNYHESRDVFEEMFKRWSNAESANGLDYFEAAKVLADGYEYQVLSILEVLSEP